MTQQECAGGYGERSVSERDQWKERAKLAQKATMLALGAVIRYHPRWLVLFFFLVAVPLCIKEFADWALPVNEWVTGFVIAVQLVGWGSAVVAFYVLIWNVGRLQMRLMLRCCLGCGYPMPPGVGQRCPECGRFAEIALPPE